MNQCDDIKSLIKFLNEGIVPMGYGSSSAAKVRWDMNRVLTEMDPQESRKMKRKFRKLWRSIVKTTLRHGGKRGREAARTTGLGETIPARKHKLSRKEFVYLFVTRREDLSQNR